ncbi:cell wall metabolism sensor histidine kinase WalK [uncultured Pseudokineococcus sp.]|uniref:sensor histidine kinase n=1 Tax=uncultured Pseudokineococcus sp. TaxID=1642928 RepID=UPI002639095C|nr:HAMP domain-containing sensor histidine kinase [uncultured Pseudokineococcus sp.]
MSPTRYARVTRRLPEPVRRRLPAEPPPPEVGPDGTERRPPASRWVDQVPLSTKLVVLVAGLLLLALLVTGVTTTSLLRSVLVGSVDDQLVAQSATPRDISSLLQRQAAGEDAAVPTDYVVVVTDDDGRVRYPPETPGADLPDLSGLDVEVAVEREGAPFGDDDWRVVAVPFPAQGEVLSIAYPLDQVDAAVSTVRTLFWLVALAVLVVAALAGRVAVRRSLRPLREVEAVAVAYGAGDASRRVPDAWPGTEVGRLGEAVNAMLERIETSLAAREASEARMRRFVADASHELRTPLAAIRGFAELHRQGAVREPADVTAAFSRVETEASRLGGLVEDLLALTRLDEQRPLRRDPVDLLVLAGDAVHDLGALAPDRAVRLTGLDGSPAPSPAPVTGDDARLRQVLTNLVGNAVRHTPAGTPLEIGVGVRRHEGGAWATWQVVDHGAGIPPDEAERVFERFYRSDTSRTRGSGGGSGLGLAIVAALVRAHGGAARVVPTPGGGATVEVALPAEELPDDDAAYDDEVDDLDGEGPLER